MTEAIDLTPREPLDDGASAETVEAMVRQIVDLANERFGPGCFGSIGRRYGSDWGDAGMRQVFVHGPRAAMIVDASAPNLDQAVAVARRQVARRPTEQQLAATLGLSEVPAND